MLCGQCGKTIWAAEGEPVICSCLRHKEGGVSLTNISHPFNEAALETMEIEMPPGWRPRHEILLGDLERIRRELQQSNYEKAGATIDKVIGTLIGYFSVEK
jgi:hypothetical protein